MKNKHILFISPRFVSPPNDGAKIVIYNTIKQLWKTNKIDYVTSYWSDDVPYLDDLDDLVEEKIYISKDMKKQFLLTLLFSFFSRKTYLFLKYYDTRILRAIQNLLQKNQYDIVWLEAAQSSIFIDFIRNIDPNIYIISRSHNVEHLLFQRIAENETSFFRKYLINQEVKFWRNQEMYDLKNSDRVYTISPSDSKYFKTIDPRLSEKLSVLYPWVDQEKYKNTQRITDDKNLVFMGALNYFPNIQGIEWFLKDIFPKILARDPDIRLIIIWHEASKLLLWEGIKNNIEIINGTNKDVFYFNKARMFIVPLKSGSWIKIKVLNAMSLWRPILSTYIWAEGLSVKHKKNILLSDNTDEWVEYILEYMNNNEKLYSIWKNAEAFISENFSWDYLFKQV